MIFTSAVFAQSDVHTFPKSEVARSGSAAKDFVPKGWMVEAMVKGDLNGDGKVDLAIKLIEQKSQGADPSVNEDRQRALVVALADKDGGYSRAAVSDGLLQCTGCGGAFYGVMPAPANVSIAKGVLIVDQDHGSRDVEKSTYKIRFDAATGRFILIGLDITDRDRLTGDVTSISTNYLTGVRITTIYPGKGRKSTKRTTVSREKQYLEDLDQGVLESIE
ncbi:MAG: hypothetical protein ABIP75_16620 [Pyrinomonadaceae bacterium]